MSTEGMKVVAEFPAGTEMIRFRDLWVFVSPDQPPCYFDTKNPSAGVQKFDAAQSSEPGGYAEF